MAIAYLNGSWQAPEAAQVSALDRGFLFGDGVYEGLAVYGGKVFEGEQHLQRLRRSLEAIGLDPGVTDDWLMELMNEGIARSGLGVASCYLQISRGPDAGRNHVWPEQMQPTIFMMISEAPKLLRQSIVPLRVALLEDFRWHRGDIKSISLLANGLLRNEAVAKGYDDAVLHRNGLLTESTSSNIFLVRAGTIYTPAASNLLLHGITRQVVLDIAENNGLACEETDCPVSWLGDAEEVWVTSTGQEAWPVASINGRDVGTGEAGPVWRQLDQLFQQYKTAQLS